MASFPIFRAIAVAVLAAGSIAACENTPPASFLGPYFFACDDGTLLNVRFDTETHTARVIGPGGRRAILRQVRAADGFWYSDGANNLRGKGREVRWETPGHAAVFCTRRS